MVVISLYFVFVLSNTNFHLEIGSNNANRVVLKNKHKKIYLFEPNPFWNYTSLIEKNSNIKHISCAAWYRNETLTFYYHKDHSGVGSSLFDRSIYLLREKKQTKVCALDLSEWIFKNIPKGSHVSARFDIEGAEYVVMRHLIFTNAVCMLSDITFEGHAMYRDDHAVFQMFDVLLPWLVQACPQVPNVRLERYYGQPGMNHDKRIKWTSQRKKDFCYACPMLINPVNEKLF